MLKEGEEGNVRSHTAGCEIADAMRKAQQAGHGEAEVQKRPLKVERPSLELADLQPEEHGSVERGKAVADGQREPDAIELRQAEGRHERWQQQEAGHQEDELSRQGEVDALARLAYTLEEIARDHLETDDGEEGNIDAHAMSGDVYQVGVGGEGTNDGLGEEFADYETGSHHDGGIADGLVEHFLHTMVQLGSVVVAGNGLHTLIESHDNHGEEEEPTVVAAIGTHGKVAAILHHTSINKEHDEAGTGIHQEWRETYREDAAHDARAELPSVAPEEDDFRRTGEDPQLPAERDALRENRGNGRTTDAEVQAVDEQRVEGGVEQHGQDCGVHRRAGMAGRAQHGVESEVEMGEDVAVENPLHVLAGVGQRLVRSAEEAEDGIEEGEDTAHEEQAHEHVESQGIAEEMLRLLAVLLTEAHADHRGRAHTYHGSEGGTEIHQGKGDGKAGNGHRPYALSDEDAVHHIVERGGRHRDDGGDGVLHEEGANGAGAEFFGSVCHSGGIFGGRTAEHRGI